MFDDSNLSQIEKDIYHTGENKTIFRNLDKLMDELKVFKSNQAKNLNLEDGTTLVSMTLFVTVKVVKESKFLKDLINFYDQGLKTDIAIKKTINKYTKVYNSDKIYEK